MKVDLPTPGTPEMPSLDDLPVDGGLQAARDHVVGERGHATARDFAHAGGVVAHALGNLARVVPQAVAQAQKLAREWLNIFRDTN